MAMWSLLVVTYSLAYCIFSYIITTVDMIMGCGFLIHGVLKHNLTFFCIVWPYISLDNFITSMYFGYTMAFWHSCCIRWLFTSYYLLHPGYFTCTPILYLDELWLLLALFVNRLPFLFGHPSSHVTLFATVKN